MPIQMGSPSPPLFGITPIGSVGGRLARIASRVLRLQVPMSSKIEQASWLKFVLWPSALTGGNVWVAIAMDSFFYTFATPVIVEQLTEWILDPLNPPLAPIPGFDVQIGADGGIVVTIPAMYYRDP